MIRSRRRPAIGDFPTVLVDELYRKCVAFLCLPDPERNWTPVGTGFFVVVEVTADIGLLYLVTARHVVEGAREVGPLHLRLNRRGGEDPQFVKLDPDVWYVAHDTDVAVAEIRPELAHACDLQYLRQSQIATSDVIAAEQVGPGDEVFFSGLFTGFPGVKRAEPVIRFGNVSMMPNEPVPIKNADDSVSHVDAFLVEARSWGGQSGSPAFVFFPATRRLGSLHLPPLGETSGGDVFIPDDVRPRLLGLVHGHFDIKTDVAFSGDVYGSAHVPLNAGVAIVIPAQKIVDTLMQEELVEDRQEFAKTLAGRSAATPDLLDVEQPGLTEFQRFEELARKLVDVPKKELDEKRKDES
jgi:hypothetical protein